MFLQQLHDRQGDRGHWGSWIFFSIWWQLITDVTWPGMSGAVGLNQPRLAWKNTGDVYLWHYVLWLSADCPFCALSFSPVVKIILSCDHQQIRMLLFLRSIGQGTGGSLTSIQTCILHVQDLLFVFLSEPYWIAWIVKSKVMSLKNSPHCNVYQCTAIFLN